jgi:hypothetical protein
VRTTLYDWRDFDPFGDERIKPWDKDPENPTTFDPRVGDTVKLVWPPAGPDLPAEAMWVAIQSVGERGQLTGILDSAPIAHPLELGDVIRFNTSDIVRMWSNDIAGHGGTALTAGAA